MILLSDLHLAIAYAFLAGKDATSYKLFTKADDLLTLKRQSRWHRDGLILAALYVAPFCFIYGPIWWMVIVSAVLIRTAVYDAAFNRYAGLPFGYVGTTAGTDSFWRKLFGINGAGIWRTLFGLSGLIAFTVYQILTL